MGVFQDIELALFRRVKLLKLEPELKVAYPNVAFDPPPGNYLRVDHLPNNSERPFFRSTDDHRHLGILQISVLSKEGAGSVATGIADQIAEFFPADLRLTENSVIVRVTKKPDTSPPLKDGSRWSLPVNISYESFV